MSVQAILYCFILMHGNNKTIVNTASNMSFPFLFINSSDNYTTGMLYMVFPSLSPYKEFVVTTS